MNKQYVLIITGVLVLVLVVAYLVINPPQSNNALRTQQFATISTAHLPPTNVPPPTVNVGPTPTSITAQSNAVAFTTDALWIANLDGSGEMRLLEDATGLAWSPDGQWLATKHQAGLWIVSPDGAKTKEIVSYEQSKNMHSFDWSPDSTRLAFVQQGAAERLHIGNSDYIPVYAYHLGIANIATGSISYYLINSSTFIDALNWSPDGKHISFLSDAPFSSKIWMIDLANKIAAANSFKCRNSSIDSLTWSPDMNWLAQGSCGNGRYGTCYVCLGNVTGEIFSVPVKGTTRDPAWSLDGRFLYLAAITPNPDHEPNLSADPRFLRFDIQEQSLEQLISLQEYDFPTGGSFGSLAISPDGQWLSALSWSREYGNIFHIVSVDGAVVIEWPVSLSDYNRPYAWSADNRHLIFVGEKGSLYVLDVHSGELTKLTILPESRWAKELVVSPSAD